MIGIAVSSRAKAKTASTSCHAISLLRDADVTQGEDEDEEQRQLAHECAQGQPVPTRPHQQNGPRPELRDRPTPALHGVTVHIRSTLDAARPRRLAHPVRPGVTAQKQGEQDDRGHQRNHPDDGRDDAARAGTALEATSASPMTGRPSLAKLFQIPETDMDTVERERENPHESYIAKFFGNAEGRAGGQSVGDGRR